MATFITTFHFTHKTTAVQLYPTEFLYYTRARRTALDITLNTASHYQYCNWQFNQALTLIDITGGQRFGRSL